jgi:hypothetical protein
MSHVIVCDVNDMGCDRRMRAGYAAAFVARPGKVLYPLGPQPDSIASDYRETARLIIAAEAAGHR